MKLVTLNRVIKTGLCNFWRNSWLSSVTISIMAFTLLIIGFLLFLNTATNVILDSLQEKIDISVYFKPGTNEEEIFKIKNELTALPEIQNITYVSQEEALARFREKHKDNSLISQSLSELDENPLEPCLNIQAKEASLYGAVVSFLETSQFKPLISNINYQESKKDIIERFALISKNMRRGALVLSLIFAIIAVLVAFNAIRLAIYDSRQEVEIMRLVGARNWFIRGPFIVSGLLYGIIGAIICLILLYAGINLVSPQLTAFAPKLDLILYFHNHILLIFGLIFSSGIALGVFSSLIAIRKYLKV
ncbi:MAG: permease-like cell division protein FtsX [bacterium]